MSNNSDIFLDAFNTIEKYLRRKTKSDRFATFKELITLVQQSDTAIRRYSIDLQEFADLRNAIVHESTDGQVIAEPNQWAVERIEQIKALVTQPPSIRTFMTRGVSDFTPADPVGKAVSFMYANAFSQVPVYDGSQFVGLLTANTISRWLGIKASEDLFSLNDTTISMVLEFTEDPDHVIFMTPDTSVYDMLERFHEYETKGKRLEAILITHSGKRTEKPMGMVTIWDLPKIHQSMSA